MFKNATKTAKYELIKCIHGNNGLAEKMIIVISENDIRKLV